jgi:hypothetical protein
LYIIYAGISEDDKRDYSARIVGRNEVRKRVFSYKLSTKQIVTILQYKNEDASKMFKMFKSSVSSTKSALCNITSLSPVSRNSSFKTHNNKKTHPEANRPEAAAGQLTFC